MLKYSAFLLSFCFFLTTVFQFQLQLVAGPFLDVLLVLGVFLTAFTLSVIYLIRYRKRHRFFYFPLALLLVPFILSVALPDLNFSIRLHFMMNKGRLENIDRLSKENKVYEMTDMLRYSKTLNDQYLSNDAKYTNETDLKKAFGSYIKKGNLSPAKLEEMRKALQDSDCISFQQTEGLLIITIDGFLDNEYGYVKLNNKKIAMGDKLPPHFFTVVQLIDLGNGWYYFATT